MKIYTKKFVDEHGVQFQILAENNTEEALLDACATPDLVDGDPKLERDGIKKFILTLPVFNGGTL